MTHTIGETIALTKVPRLISGISVTSQADMDAAVAALDAQKDAWVALGARERIGILDQVIEDMIQVSDRWVAAGLTARGVDPNSPTAGEEWYTLSIVLRQLHMLRRSLEEIEAHGRPLIPGPVTTRSGGQVVAQVSLAHGMTASCSGALRLRSGWSQASRPRKLPIRWRRSIATSSPRGGYR